MTARLATLVTLLLALTACGGGDPHTTTAKEYAGWLTQICDKFEGIKDKAGAEAAKADLEKLATTGQDLMKKMKELGEPSAELQKTLEPIVKGPTERLQKVMMGMTKKDPAIVAVLQGVMSKLAMAK